MDEHVQGQCLCGAVRFDVALPVKWCAHCHCSMCRRAHGAAFVTWVGVRRDRFRLLDGAEVLTSHASSPAARRSFCGRCGSMLTFESERWAGEVHVTRASLPPEAPITPQAHVFFDDRAPWLHCDDDLPRLGGTTGTEPIPGPTR